MAYKSITFNGVRKDWLYIERGRSKPPFAARSRNLLTVPGYPGGYLQSTDIEPLNINQPVGFHIKDDADALRKKDELAEWLITDEVVKLQFDDEPGRIYYAVVQNSIDDFEKMSRLRKGTIQFICPDPYGYGEEKPFVASSDYFQITNTGTAESEPIFEFEVLAPITFLLIQNQLGMYNMIGQPVDVDSIVYNPLTKILDNTMASTTGWTDGTQVDNGVVSGTMTSDGDKFIVSSFGSPSDGSKWYGPALKTSLSETLQDFVMDISLSNFNSVAGVGRVEVYLLDVNGSVIAKIALTDSWEAVKRNRMEAYIQDVNGDRKYLMTLSQTTDESNGELWDDFLGILRLRRNGNVWTSYIAKVDNGLHSARETKYFTDGEGIYQRPVAQVQVHIGKFGDYETTEMAIRDTRFWKINQPSDVEVPYIAYQGDKIIFDHTNNGQVYINGEPYESSILGADFFALEKGENNLIVMPENTVNTSGSYRNRYL
ncbi:distal tail protein Dit [Paraliobacillus sp. X-1268]|uniref:distal tail protein Dit n=1 Tax=Paraliobacillus sp. X-1268 TaxID=2213193 RepID=UPI000E3CFEED|nr:distal tail protein Dit [Paraliobacillus sp. X-1268]